MSQYVDECRDEWKRLGVPDPVANEMAADLEADLKEAEAEGASPEDALGSGAFDPRSFAASWAAERGVVPPPAGTGESPPVIGRILPGRSRVLTALAAFGFIAIIGVTLAVQPFRVGPAQVALASHVTRPILQVIPGLPQAPLQPPPGLTVRPFGVHMNVPGIYPHTIGLILLLVGIVGLILSNLYWLPRRRHSNRAAGGPSYL